VESPKFVEEYSKRKLTYRKNKLLTLADLACERAVVAVKEGMFLMSFNPPAWFDMAVPNHIS
jgi:hypothetical protein